MGLHQIVTSEEEDKPQLPKVTILFEEGHLTHELRIEDFNFLLLVYTLKPSVKPGVSFDTDPPLRDSYRHIEVWHGTLRLDVDVSLRVGGGR